MKNIFNQLNKIFVTDSFLEKLTGKDRIYTKETISHIGVLKDNYNFYAFSHKTNKGHLVTKQLNTAVIKLHKRQVSFERNLKGELKPQFISGPAFNFHDKLDLKAIEIFRHEKAKEFEPMDRFFRYHEYKIMQIIEEIDEHDGVIFLENDNLIIKKIHHFDKLD